MNSYLITSVITSIVMLLFNAVGLWSAASAVMDDPIAFGTYFTASIVYLPALWVMTGLALLLVGFAPRFTSLSWLYLVYSFVVVYLGGLLKFPEWLTKITPFGYVPNVPIEEMSTLPLISLTIIAIELISIGFVSYRKRDLYG